jgi:hypothetical protein
MLPSTYTDGVVGHWQSAIDAGIIRVANAQELRFSPFEPFALAKQLAAIFIDLVGRRMFPISARVEIYLFQCAEHEHKNTLFSIHALQLHEIIEQHDFE